MSDKSNNRDIRLTWVQGANGYAIGSVIVDYEKSLLDALYNDLTSRVETKNIEYELLGSDFAEANQIINQIKQQIRDKKQ